MKISSSTKRLLLRTVIFIGLFVLTTGIIGPWVIGTKLLYGFQFFIYGNLGKLVIFSAIIFLLLIRDKLGTLKLERFNPKNFFYIVPAVLLIPVFFLLSNKLLTYISFTQNIFLFLLTHIVLISIPLLFFLGVFGMKFTRMLIKIFRKELLICVGLSGVLFVAIFQVWKLWPFFSNLVLQVQYFIFSKLYDNVAIIPPRGLFVNTFAVEIAEACSGLESIFLFTVLYIFISVLDWKKLILKRVLLLFPLLLAGLVIVNIVRVFVLILVGVLINPQIMAALFHTYLGLLLFVAYFLLFMRFGYGWLKKK